MESRSPLVQNNEFLEVLLQPFQIFLSDPIGKQNAMSKRGQETTCSEGSPMAKPKPMVPAKAKPVNLVLRSPWSARENLPIRGTSMKDKVIIISTRRLVRATQNPEVERSQSEATGKCSKFRFLETVRSGGSFKLHLYKETCTDSDSKNRVSRTRTINTWRRSSISHKRSCELQQVTQYSRWMHQRQMCWCGECSCLRQWKQPFILDRSIWRTCRSTRTRTSRKFRAYSISHRSWYWSILKKFWMWIRITVHLPYGRDPYCLMIKWSSGQMQKYVFAQKPHYAWWR